MIFVGLLTFFSIQIIDTQCVEKFRILGESVSENKNDEILPLFLDTYALLIENLPLDELHQLQKNPLEIPRSKQLTALSSYQPILEHLISLIRQNFILEKIENLQIKLYALISEELESRKSNMVTQNLFIKEKSVIASSRLFLKLNREIIQMDLSEDGKILYMITADLRLHFVDAKNGNPILFQNKPIIIHLPSTKFSGCFALSKKKKLIYVGGRDFGDIKIFDSETGEDRTRDIQGSTFYSMQGAPVRKLILSPDEEVLYVNYRDGKMLFWNTLTGTPVQYLKSEVPTVGVNINIETFALSPDGSYIYAISQSSLVIIDAKTGAILNQVETSLLRGLNEVSILVSSDGSILYINHQGAIFRFLDIERLHSNIVIPICRLIFPSVNKEEAFIIDRKRNILLISGTDKIFFTHEKTGKFLNDSNFNPLGINTPQNNKIRSLALSPDEDTVFSSYADGSIYSHHLPDHLPD